MSWKDIPGRYAMRWIVDDALERTPTGGIWVEVGVALGKGTAYMARRLLDAKRDDVILYAVDPWGGFARNGEQQANAPPSDHGDWKLFLANMRASAPEELERIHILRCKSVSAASAIVFETNVSKPVSLCILDADHTHKAVQEDLQAWAPLIRPGGFIAGDDHEADFPGVEEALKDRWGLDYETRAEEWAPGQRWTTWRKAAEPGL